MSLLSHRIVSSDGESPKQRIAFLHGILGTKANWGSIAKKFVEAEPAWGALLVDLRMHGESQDFAAPHTLDACTQDLLKLQQSFSEPVRRIVGHSFGGKVAIRWASKIPDIEQLWIVDSNPGLSGSSDLRSEVALVLDILKRTPDTLKDRKAFLDFVMSESLSEPTARWLAMNVREKEGAQGGIRINLDLSAIQDLLQDYRVNDCWPGIESIAQRSQVHLVVAGLSEVLDENAKERARKLSERQKNFHLHTIENSGHWVHVQAPQELLKLLTDAI